MRYWVRHTTSMIVGSIMLATFLSGCVSQRLTMSNFDKLEAGMARSRVEEIIGKPARCDGAMGVANCMWGDEQRYVQAQFVGDRALAFQYKNLK